MATRRTILIAGAVILGSLVIDWFMPHSRPRTARAADEASDEPVIELVTSPSAVEPPAASIERREPTAPGAAR